MQIEAMNIVGEIRGKHCIIVDDMIDTAGNQTLPLSTQSSSYTTVYSAMYDSG